MKLLPDRTTYFCKDIDLKCTTCKFYCDATALQIWCDKLGIKKPMPSKSCNKYKKDKNPYTVIVGENMTTIFMKMAAEVAKTHNIMYIALEAKKG
jgi:hypothetical protein